MSKQIILGNQGVTKGILAIILPEQGMTLKSLKAGTQGAVAQIGTALNEGGYSRKIMCFFTVAAVDDRGIPVKSAQFGFGQRALKR